MTNRSVGSAPNALKVNEKILNDENNRASALQDVSKEEILHSTHSLKWCSGDKRPIVVTCDKAGTVWDLLKKSAQFRKLEEKNKNKELVITRDGKALSSHFPCSLFQKDECVTVKFVKAVKQTKKPAGVSVFSSQNNTSCELVMFHVLAKGDKNITKIMRNPELRKIHEVTVYAYKGEKVKQALRRDGRFLSVLYKKNCALCCRSSGVNSELSNLVDDLSGKTFQITLLNKESVPNSIPSSLDEDYLMSNEGQSQSDSLNGSTYKKEACLDGNIKPEQIPQEETRLKKRLCLQFDDSVKAIRPCASKLSRIQNLFRLEFGQNAEMCREVKTMKKLMELSDSVCQVRINGRPHGSGFLVFGCCVLTNGHVIKDIYNENCKQLFEKVSVDFTYESVEQTAGSLDVEELVGFEYRPGVLGGDWALLKLSTNQTLPASLLKHFSVPSKDGGICIIGHPDGHVKKIDPCLIVPSQSCTQVVKRHYWENQSHVQLITNSFFENVASSVQQQNVLFYESCFYFGSSGSPVFDKHCNVIAVHSGGHAYSTASGKTQSVIEFGHPLPAIMEGLVIQLVERKKVDVLKEYLACDFDKHQIIMKDVKKLVESRNLARFREAARDLVHENDINLKKFCEFFLLKEEPVSMEI